MTGTYYADKFVGRKTSNGEIFRQNQYTAAHKSIPLGTYVLVTNPANGRQIVVRVNDRCPVKNVLDLTKLAAKVLGIKGSNKVIVTRLDSDTGYDIWVGQDTLVMTREEYMSFRDKSHVKRISPYPIGPCESATEEMASRHIPVPTPKATPAKKKNTKKTTPEPETTAPVPVDDTVPTMPENTPADTIEATPIQGPKYDLSLCIVNSRNAAYREIARLPKDLQPKVVLNTDPKNGQIQILLDVADSRSHVVRLQAMLIDDYPDSCITAHLEK